MKEFVSQKYERAKVPFEKAILIDGKNHWHRDEEPGERAYMNWLNEVRDPVTKAFYKGHKTELKFDEDGHEIPGESTIIDLEPERTVTQLTRIKTATGEEFLYSIGQIIAYNQFGDPKVRSYTKPESWEETSFVFNTRIDPTDNRLKRACDGPIGQVTRYTMPFTKDNVMSLYQLRDKKQGCSLVVELEGTQAKKEAPDLDTFINKPFDYIINEDYLTPQEKKEAREKFEKDQAQLMSTAKTGKK